MEANSSLFNEMQNGIEFEPEDNVFGTIWKQYERVIVESLITSFGLDFLVKDQEGGDVDTIYNVRNQKDNAGKTVYKDKVNQNEYESRPNWDKKLSDSFYQDERYKASNARAAEAKDKGILVDAYTGKSVKRNEKIDIDHVIAKKEIYDDPGRVLAGLDAKDLANSEDNLRATSRSINRSMKDKDLAEYADKLDLTREERRNQIDQLKSKTSLSDRERKQLEKLEKLEEANPQLMKKESARARKSYEAKLAHAYYTSPTFIKNSAQAAAKTGAQMGIRQVLGLVFTEMWFCTKEELENIAAGSELKEMIEAIGNGIRKGLEKAKEKYTDLIEKFGEGLTSGALSSLTTTLCNIFFTTAKNLVRSIRQIYASIVQAGKILLFNPENLMLGDRVKTATIIIATGASVLVGTTVSGLIATTPLGQIPVIGEIVQSFCAALTSGLLSCTLLVFLDRSKLINGIINCLNAIPSEVNNYKEIADMMELLAAKLSNLDIDKFSSDTKQYAEIADKIANAVNEDELNRMLLLAYKDFHIEIPWEGDFNSFMSNPSNRLVFE